MSNHKSQLHTTFGNITQTVSGDSNVQQVGQSNESSINIQSGVASEANMITPGDLADFRKMMATLKASLKQEIPPEQQNLALEKVEELETAIIADKPKLSTIEYVRDWFIDNIPKCSGTVTSMIVHPIVGKIVSAGGDMLASEFRRRFEMNQDI